MAARKAKGEVVTDEPKREIFPSPEWFEVPNLTPAVRFYGIERVAAKLIDGLPEALREYRSACETIEYFRSMGMENTSSLIQYQWVLAEEARRQRIKWEDWLRTLADQATTYLPELSLPCVTQKPVGLDSSEKQQPVLNELETIKAAAIRERVKAETAAVEQGNHKPKRKSKPKNWWATEPPGDGWHGVPLIGMKRELTRWVGVALRGTPVDEATLATMHTKSIWIWRVDRTTWRAYFRNDKLFAAANAESLKPETGTQTGAKRTKREPTGSLRKKSPRK